ncbi:MAG: hypothetical protein ACLT3F_10755 [Gemmiger formicilis]|uniref:hypothetical protein n=1 Tax=Gemmiger formicilis TaxID=745368 RepID=UPI003996C70A
MNHEHNWVDVPVSLKGEVFGMEYQVSIKHCTICNLYDHTISLAGYSYEYFAMTAAPGVEGVIQNLAIKLYCSIFGENATATKFTPGGGSTSGGGVGRPKGYADDSGTPSINSQGQLIVVPEFNYYRIYFYNSSTLFAVGNYTGSVSNKKYYDVVTDITSEHCNILAYTSSSYTGTCLEISYKVVAPVNGYYTVPKQSIGYNDVQDNYLNKMYSVQRTISSDRKYYSKGQTITLSISGDAGDNFNCGYSEVLAYFIYPKIICEPIETTVNQYNKLSINNNTWNGNIYVDNSNNLTYIYPQYTTVNEKSETVTNISNTPIIYNNETKQYYTCDQTTKNYYYITYNENPTTPTPSPSPTPDPDNPSVTPTPTPTPGGDTGDTTGILAVLVEIRDNMIQGFLDIKAAFVAGFAELSANFTLAIENLTLNIQNFFFKGMSGSPVDPNIPGGGSGTISTPETGGKDNNTSSGWSWNPLKWLSDLLKDIVEGIIKAIWKLITALFGFLLWLLSLVGSLFPFIPGQAVLAVTSAVVIVAVIRIIKFITGR